jgi:hypothetical protein
LKKKKPKNYSEQDLFATGIIINCGICKDKVKISPMKPEATTVSILKHRISIKLMPLVAKKCCYRCCLKNAKKLCKKFIKI